MKSFRYPDADVINQALNLYTMQLRRPALTVLVVDVSGSMGDEGKLDKLKEAMSTLLLRGQGVAVLPSGLAPRYARSFIPFCGEPQQPMIVEADPEHPDAFYGKMHAAQSTGPASEAV